MNIFSESVLNLEPITQDIIYTIRILCSLVCCGVIGYERAIRFKEAGVRTHCIVGVAACALMILSKYGYMDLTTGYDPGRIAAQVVTGIGFLGTAIVFKQGNSVHGLTTAAGIWATATIGMIFGAGLYVFGFIVTFTLLLVLFFLHKFNLANDSYVLTNVSIVIAHDDETKKKVLDILKTHDVIIVHTHLAHLDDGKIKMDLVCRIKKDFTFEEIQKFLNENKDISEFSV